MQRVSFGLAWRSAATLGLALILMPATAHAAAFQVNNLVSDIPGNADHTNSNLVNPWGLAFGPTTPAWTANNGTGTATLFDGKGNAQNLVVTIPPAPGQSTADPTGLVFNGSTSDFLLSPNNPARFIFATESGTIAAWNPNVPLPAPSTQAQQVLDNSGGSSPSVFKGLAIGTSSSGERIFATDFRNGVVDMFNSNFKPQGSFTDPNVPSGFAPFGIQNINGNIVVTFAQQNQAKHDDVAGDGHGFVSVFDTNGNLLKSELIAHGVLNSPWGLAIAPSGFGSFGGALLVGNFGNGKINAFDPTTGAFLGTLKDSQGKDIAIDGLWSLKFGNGVATQPENAMFFTAGIDGEMHGLFGSIAAVPEPACTAGVLMLGGALGIYLFGRRRDLRNQASRRAEGKL